MLPTRRPWLGRSLFVHPSPQPARRFVAETREESFWRRRMPWLFMSASSSALTKFINRVGVTPLAHVTLLNLNYQIYLNQIMHTSAGAWIGHAVCVPVNVGLLFYALAVYTPIGSGSLPLNGGLVLLAVLAVWYSAMAVRLRSPLWGCAALSLLAGLWMLANVCASRVVAVGDPMPVYCNPLVLIVCTSLLQSLSHLFEPNVPPRANFGRGWQPVGEFLWGKPSQSVLSRLLRLPIGAIWGALDEWWASAKLLPLYVLEIMWICGYQREQRDQFRASSLRALDSGDPALDWVGVGGGASVLELGECTLKPR